MILAKDHATWREHQSSVCSANCQLLAFLRILRQTTNKTQKKQQLSNY